MTLVWWDMTPQEVREGINQHIMQIEAETVPVFSVEEMVIAPRNTTLRIYKPDDGADFPLVLLIHGGAWVAGNLDTHDNLARYLCANANVMVISVGYLNAPEGKFPLQLEQCYDALFYASTLSNKIAVAGDSAGGNMSAALCLMAKDRNGPKIALQVLINPAPLNCNVAPERQNFGYEQIRWQTIQYVSKPEEITHFYVSPLLADLSDLPPATIILAENDPLLPEGEDYVEKLKQSGVPTDVFCQHGIGHLAGHGARASKQAKQSLDAAVQSLKNTFH